MPTAFHWSAVYLASEWAIRFAMLAIVPQQRSAAAARTWLLLIFLLPIPGLVLYGIFGRIYLPKRRLEMQQQASKTIREVQAQMPSAVEPAAAALPESVRVVSALALALGDFRPMAGNRVELLDDYEGSIRWLVADIDAARRDVHLVTYLFAPDATGERMAQALMRAADRGVRCRVLMDAVGSYGGMKRLAPRLRAAGVAVHAALPVGLFRRSAARFDLRNHRKVAVIDGALGYIGSQNIVDGTFVAGHPNEELVVRLSGPAVAQLQALVASDLYFESGERLDRSGAFPPVAAAGRSMVQLLPSGPAYARENTKELMIALVHGARHRVVVTTPYLIPDESFLQAVEIAALRGVDVRIVVSRRSNQWLAQLAQQSYYETLLGAGVAIYFYRPRFLHAKHISVDDDVAMIGSTNVDIRSFSLNAEANLLIYDPLVVAALRATQERYFADSDLLTAETWRRRPLANRMLQNVARLADSFL